MSCVDGAGWWNTESVTGVDGLGQFPHDFEGSQRWQGNEKIGVQKWQKVETEERRILRIASQDGARSASRSSGISMGAMASVSRLGW